MSSTRRPPSPALVVDESTFALWQRLAQFPPAQTDAALRFMQQWIARAVDADNVIWIGAVRALRGQAAAKDPMFGWRLRARSALRPDPEPYRRLLKEYYIPDHYGRLTPGYYERSHESKKDAHIGTTARASFVQAGSFRVYRLRDKSFLDYAAFKRTEQYRLYYRDVFADRMTIGFPVARGVESFFLIDRFFGRKPFARRDAAIAGGAIRGVPTLHWHLIVSHGLSRGEKGLSPLERQVLLALLGPGTEKDIAAQLGVQQGTLHNYVTALYARMGVASRAALTALWLSLG